MQTVNISIDSSLLMYEWACAKSIIKKILQRANSLAHAGHFADANAS